MAFSSLENRSFTSQATVGKKSPQETIRLISNEFYFVSEKSFFVIRSAWPWKVLVSTAKTRLFCILRFTTSYLMYINNYHFFKLRIEIKLIRLKNISTILFLRGYFWGDFFPIGSKPSSSEWMSSNVLSNSWSTTWSFKGQKDMTFSFWACPIKTGRKVWSSYVEMIVRLWKPPYYWLKIY